MRSEMVDAPIDSGNEAERPEVGFLVTNSCFYSGHHPDLGSLAGELLTTPGPSIYAQ
jgi:hypothetical protein